VALTAIPAAGAKLRASVLSALITEARPACIVKAATETVNNSAALQNDDALLLAVLANAQYRFELRLEYISGTTPDLKIAWTFPAGTTMVWGGAYADTAGAMVTNGNFLQTTTLAMGGTGTDVTAFFSGSVNTAGTSGTLQLQWAQNTANASDSKIYLGSYLLLDRVG
jgi:hypothetical protein